MRFLVLTLLLPLAACTGADGDTDDSQTAEDSIQTDEEQIDLGQISTGVLFQDEPPGDLVDAVQTTDGSIEMGVTNAGLFARLSADVQAEIETSMKEETEDQTGMGGAIARAVTGAVAEGLSASVSVPLSEIEDVRYEGGRVVVEMVNGNPSPFESTETNGRPVLEQFDAAAGERLAAAFDKATQ
ncbi:MAG: hypothetical protein AAGK21_02410 [Bacteroidota bacterium]